MDSSLVVVKEDQQLENLTDEEWKRLQLERGNRIMNRFDDFRLRVSKNQQQILNALEINMNHVLKEMRKKDDDLRKKDDNRKKG
jgi:hypothetical protein